MKRCPRSTRASELKSSPQTHAKSNAGFTCRPNGRRTSAKGVLDISRFSMGAGVTPAEGSVKPTAGFTFNKVRSLAFDVGRDRLRLIAALQSELIDPILQCPVAHREHFGCFGDYPVVALERL